LLDHYSDEDADIRACQRLWQAVLLQALRDASEQPTVRQAEVEQRDARTFILNRHSAWAEAREWVCMAAGIDAAKVLRCYLRLLGDPRLERKGPLD
jgi:hypothetical protein